VQDVTAASEVGANDAVANTEGDEEIVYFGVAGTYVVDDVEFERHVPKKVSKELADKLLSGDNGAKFKRV
jgi:hypothetical protein